MTKKKDDKTANSQDKKKKKITTLKQFLRAMSKMFIVDPCPIDVLKDHTSYEIVTGSPISMKKEYKLLIAQPENNTLNRYLIRVPVIRGSHSKHIYIGHVSDKQARKWKNFPEAKQLIEQHKITNIAKEITPFDLVKTIALYKNCSSPKDMMTEHITWLLDDTGTKPQYLIDIALAGFIPMPMYMRTTLFRYMPHSMIYSESGTGKSTTFENIIGCVPSDEWSAAGTKGSYRRGIGYQVSPLSDIGLKPFDEVTAKDDEGRKLLDVILNYLSHGEIVRDLSPPIKTRGTKMCVFMGNTGSKKSFKHSVRGIADTSQLARIGRRIKIMIWDTSPSKVKQDKELSPEETKHKEESRNFFENVFMFYEKRIWSFIKRNMWYVVTDDEYKKECEELAGLCPDSDYADFIKANALSSSSLKFAALKKFVTLNLLDIVTASKRGVITGKDLKELESYYQEYKAYNMDSFRAISGEDTEYNRFVSLLSGSNFRDLVAEKNLTNEYCSMIMEKLELSESTTRRFWRRWLYTPVGIRRT